MSNQILISSGAKLRDLDDVIVGTDGVLTSLGFNVANGVPKLDENGKILVSQLPNSVMEFKGVWNAATNTPTLADGTGNAGDVYLCNVAGTVNFGAGPITFAVGDYAVYTGTVWARSSGATGTVTSVGLSRSGDALTVTGSPITTSGTINIGFAGTNLQYINGAGNLVTFPTIALEAQRLITEVYNETGATLTKGTVVYINGGHGNLPTITKAIATGDATSAQTYGIVQNDIGNNDNGFVVVIGSLMDLDTQAYTEGTQLYLSSTIAGAYTSVKQYAPAHLVYVAIVTRSHPTQGVIEVRIQNGFEMDELHNVAAQNPDNNDILQYKTATSLWTKVAGTTSNIAEGSNLYFTDARARAAISLTTTGSTGAATYNSTTGVLNIPQYADQYVGTVTSVGLSAPTGFSVSGSPVTTTGTLALSFASGYSLPTNVKQSNWDDAYTWVAAFPTQTGNTGKFLTTDGSTLSWATVIAGVQSVTASSPLFSSGGANPNITIQVANTSQNGYLSSTDWNTFNGKQAGSTNLTSLSGLTYASTSFVKMTAAGTFALDTNTYALASALSGYLPLTGGTLTGPLNGTKAFFEAPLTLNEVALEAKWVGVGGFIAKLINTTTQPYATYVFNNGRVGVGVTSPNYLLDVNGQGNFSGSIITNGNLFYANTATLASYVGMEYQYGGTTYGYTKASASDGELRLYIGPSSGWGGTMTFYTDNSEKARFTNGGNFLIGTTTNAGYKLDVNGISRFKDYATIDGTTQNVLLYLNGISKNPAIAFQATGIDKTYIQMDGSNNLNFLVNGGGVTALSLAYSTGAATFSSSVTTGNNLTVNGVGVYNRGKAGSGVESLDALQLRNIGTGAIGDSINIKFVNTGGTQIANIAGLLGPDNVAYGSLSFQTRNYFTDSMVEMMRITNRNNVLINTSTGVTGGGTLQVNGNVNINGVFQINGVTIGGGGGSGVTGSGTTNYITKWSSSSSLSNSIMYDTGTNVGFNTTSPAYTLDVNGSFGFRNTGYIFDAVLYSFNSSTGTYFGFGNNSTGGRLFMSDNATPLQLQAGGGPVLIGTTANNGYKLQLNGSASFAYGFLSVYRGSSSPNDILVGNDGSRFYIGGNTYVAGTITSTSSVSASGGFFDTSDSRLKTLVEDNYLLSSIANVKAKLYKKDGRMELGYYAQDLDVILPSAVKEGSDGFLSLSYAQVHTAKIAVIEDKVTILENEVAELKSKLQKYEA